jgi:hypothetical protein
MHVFANQAVTKNRIDKGRITARHLNRLATPRKVPRLKHTAQQVQKPNLDLVDDGFRQIARLKT